MQTEGAGYKILNVYNNAATYGQTLLWGWRVNAFCPPADKDLLRSCTPGTVAFQWNTLCADGRCVCDTRDSNGKCNKRDQWNNDPDKSYINIQFCDDFFKQQTLQQTIDAGKNAPKESKYNLDYYWHSKGKEDLFMTVENGSDKSQARFCSMSYFTAPRWAPKQTRTWA
jgi:hypothetical protein